MKTAVDWIRDIDDYSKSDVPMCDDISPKLIEMIQLDALKHAVELGDKMLDMAEYEASCPCRSSVIAYQQAILAEADKLTKEGA